MIQILQAVDKQLLRNLQKQFKEEMNLKNLKIDRLIKNISIFFDLLKYFFNIFLIKLKLKDQLLLSVIPPYLTDKVSKSIFATSSAADFSKQGTTQMKLFHELHVQVKNFKNLLKHQKTKINIISLKKGSR